MQIWSNNSSAPKPQTTFTDEPMLSVPLASQDSDRGVAQALVLAVHPPNLAWRDADITGRHISVRADMAIKLSDKALHGNEQDESLVCSACL